MLRSLALGWLLACALLAGQAMAAQKVTILFTGDNGGEVAPCG